MRTIVVAVLGFGCVVSAAADVGVTVWAGAGGIVRQGTTVPIVVQLQNDERDRTGMVMVGFPQAGPPVTWAVQPLSLAPNARKRVFLYLPLQSFMADSIVVRYESPSGAAWVSHKEDIELEGSDTAMVAAVGELPRGLPSQEVNERLRYRGVMLQPELLPGRFEGLEMYDAVLLTPAPTRALEQEQVTALEDWVLRGGTLVVDASRRTDGLEQGTLRELLPFVPQATEQRTLSLFGTPMAFAVGTVREGEVLLTSDGVPLVVRRNYGMGSIVCFAFDPNEPAFLKQTKQASLWKDILGNLQLDKKASGEWDATYRSNSVDWVVSKVAGEPQTPMRLGLVILLTAIYALAVGPGDYFLVKRLGRPRLTWVTFPLMALGFAGAAYMGAAYWFGGETVTKGFRHLTLFPEQGKALAFDALGVFAGHSGEYELTHADGAALRHVHGDFDAEQPLLTEADPPRILQQIPVWSQRVYAGGHTLDECPDIELAAERNGNTAVVRVTNRSELRLANCRVEWRELEGTVNAILPGATVEVQMVPEPPTKPEEEFPQIAMETLIGESPFVREMVAADALRRGAVMLEADVRGGAPSPLMIDGQQRTDSLTQSVTVVCYGGGQE